MAKKKECPQPTDAELGILRVLWARGPSTVREVHENLHQPGVGYTTVLKQLQVMFGKGFVLRDERFRTHVYRPTAKEEQTQVNLLRNLLQRAFGGSAKKLLVGALAASKASKSEIREIRDILDQLEKGGPS